jgi:hypothetical protein
MRRKDALLISFFCGSIAIIILMIFILLFIPDEALNITETHSDTMIYSSVPTFRFFFMIIFTLAAAGVAVKILKTYRINYMYIFEFDPQYKITHA